MSDQSSIEWTDATWNPTVGCSLIAKGCAHCYAMRMAWRHVLMCKGLGRPCKYDGTVEMTPNGPRWTGVVRLDPDSLSTPLHWKKPRRIFVDSMSDLFHEGLTDHEIAACFGVMLAAWWHTFQVLTKRPERAARFFTSGVTAFDCVKAARDYGVEIGWPGVVINGEIVDRSLPLPNVWIGTSIAEQKDADANIPHLLQVPTAVRFLSCEPLIGPIEFSDVTKRSDAVSQLGKAALDGIHWVIVGGESGHGARPCDVAWVDSVVAQCAAVNVPCFVKQLGARPFVTLDEERTAGDIESHPMMSWPADSQWSEHDGAAWPLLDDRKGGNWSEWPERLRVRQFPEPLASRSEVGAEPEVSNAR